MSKHALLSPSSSFRWLNCAPSALLESEFENRTSQAAEEGTAAHALCEYKLKATLHRESKKPTLDYDNDEMQEHTDAYVAFVMEQYEIEKQNCKDPLVLIEQRVDFSDYVPGGYHYGTADCIIVSDNKLHVIDFKFGMTMIEAYDNPQLKCYAIGALVYNILFDFEEVAMTIFQPRRDNVSTWMISVSDLMEWAENELKPKAQMAKNGEGNYCPGKWCTFCRAAVRCRARAEEKLKLAQDEFKSPSLLTDEEIEEFLSVIPDLTKWANEIMAYATDSAINHGKKWNGFKIVSGRSVRKYKDEDLVAKTAIAHGYTEIYRQNLISLTVMQKLMGKKQFENILGDLIFKPVGKPVLVPGTDKRPAINVSNAKNEFNEIMED